MLRRYRNKKGALQSNAPGRDDLFAVLWCPNNIFPLQLRFSFCNKEISAQNVKPSKPDESYETPMYPVYSFDGDL
jgi:hypothetical protein